MKPVYTSSNSAEVGLMQSVLESADIPCEVRNQSVAAIMGTVPFASEVWVLRDEDFEEACRVVAEFSQKSE